MSVKRLAISPNTATATVPQRRVMTWLTTVLIAVFLLFPAVVGAWFLLDPVLQVDTGPRFVWVELTNLSNLSDDGVARKFVVRVPFRDAWSRRVAPGGAVYLTRAPRTDEVNAFSAVAPGCGCAVDYDARRRTYRDSCHAGQFDSDGVRLPDCPSPRDLDALDVELRGNTIWVKHQAFELGTSERVALPLAEIPK